MAKPQVRRRLPSAPRRAVAATVALNAGVAVRRADVKAIQKQLRAQGADPGDTPSGNATFLEAAE